MGHPKFFLHLKWENKKGVALVGAAHFLFVAYYWLTPLARKPPSTTRVCPVTKDAPSEAR